MRTRLAEPSTLISSHWPHLGLLHPPALDVLAHHARSLAILRTCNRLQSFPLPSTQLHNFMLQSFLALVMRPLDRPAARLVATRHPARDARLRLVPPYVGVDGGEEGIVGVLERGRGQDLGQGVRELLLVQIAEQEV